VTAAISHVRARVWFTDGPKAIYPEQTHRSALLPPALTGVCFSGGGTRSYAATVGQLRGLTATGLINRVGYLSAVSGGAWAATSYTYYPPTEGVDSDLDLLGAPTDPEELSLGALTQLDPRLLGFAATGDFLTALAAARAVRSVGRDAVWARAVGLTFLSPFGLYDPDQRVSFTLDDSTAKEIRLRHSSLRHFRFHTVRAAAYRPYLLVHSALNWPSDEPDLTRVNLVGFEYSPLGIGSGQRLMLRSGGHPAHAVGGGFVEPFAFGSDAPSAGPASDGLVTLTLPSDPFTLADAIGASSAFSTPDRDLRGYPHATYWPLRGSNSAGTSEVFTDGGDVENYGLISLLRRGVKAVVVFINTMWPLSVDHDPANWPRHGAVDPSLAPLFGAPGTRFSHNRVFPEADYRVVVAGLQAAKRRGDTVMTTTRHVVQPNPWWGLTGDTEVTICWCYNEHVERWFRLLPSPVRRLVQQGRSGKPDGPFARFPHYLTRAQNPGRLIRLTPAQVNLLAHLSCWNVMENQDVLGDVFDLA